MASAPIPSHIAAIERPADVLFKWYILRAIFSGPAFVVVMPVLYFRFHTMRYRFDAEGIHMKWGILLRREIMLNYSRIQDIQLRSNLFERWFGLTRIEIQTASGSAGSEMVLEGLLNFVQVRDFLYSRMRGAQHHDVPHAAAAADHSLAGLLGEIATELRGVREQLEKRDGTRGAHH
jgi:uncharacterized membrane protein YdbT with pleckstrin-like domain